MRQTDITVAIASEPRSRLALRATAPSRSEGCATLARRSFSEGGCRGAVKPLVELVHSVNDFDEDAEQRPMPGDPCDRVGGYPDDGMFVDLVVFAEWAVS
jgi:hypothetical protein